MDSDTPNETRANNNAFDFFHIISFCFFLLLVTASSQTFSANELNTEKSIQAIAEKLNNYKTIRKATNELIELSETKQAALLPLIELYTDKNSHKGTTHEVLSTVYRHMNKYFKRNAASPETIDKLIDSISYCIKEKTIWSRRLPLTLINVSENSKLKAPQIDRLVSAAKRDQEINKYRLHPADAAIPILRAISLQGKHRLFNKNVREFAKKYIKSPHGQTQITGMRVFSSQLHLNDKESLAVIQNILNNPASRSLSFRTLREYIDILKTKKNADGNILKLLKQYQNHETNRSNHPRIFKPLLKNPYIADVTRAKILSITSNSTQAASDYMKLISTRKQITLNKIDDPEIEFLISLYPKYPDQELGRQAMSLLNEIKQKQGLSPYIHHKLIEQLIRLPKPNDRNPFRKFVMESIPFAYFHGNTYYKYDRRIIESLTTSINSSRNNIYLILVLKKISKHQLITQRNMDRLYPLFSSQAKRVQNSAIIDIIINNHKKSGQLDMIAIKTMIQQHAMADRELLRIFFLEITRQENSNPQQILLDYYQSPYLPDIARRSALSTLINHDFSFAQENALPPYALDSQKMKQQVWSLFISSSKREKKPLHKHKLKEATNDQDTVIQRLAWDELKRSHGVRIPLLRQIKHPYYSKVLKFNLLSIGSLVSIILSFFLYVGGIRKHDGKLWGFTQIGLWILATLAFIGLSVGGILIGGLSHSGYPYSYANNLLTITNSVFLGLGILIRIVTTVYFVPNK